MKNTGSKQAEKKIRKYIAGGMGIWNVLSWLALLGALATLSMCTVFAKSDDISKAAPFDPINSGNDDYVYLDIVGISDWFYEYTIDSTKQTYYVAMDNDGYRYIVEMKPSDMGKLTAQNDWWNSDATDKPPAAERVYGSPSSLSSDKIKDFSGVFEISEDEFEKYFGTKCFDAWSSPAKGTNSLYTFFTVILGVMWLMFSIASRSINGGAKRSIAALKRRGELDQAAAELEASSGGVIGLDRARATEHYLFGRGTGSVLRYEDILWFYDRSVYNRRTLAATYIVANTAEKKGINAVNFGAAGNTPQLVEQVSQIILEHNPDAMSGFSKENKREYKALAQQAKKGNK